MKKYKNIQMEHMMKNLEPILERRDKIGYIAARNTRILREALSEYIMFKERLIKKYGEPDKDEEGNELGTVSIRPSSENAKKFIEEFEEIAEIEHEVELMTISYEDAIGNLSGEEILKLEWMFIEGDTDGT